MDMKVQLKEKGIFSSVLHITSNFVADKDFLSIEKFGSYPWNKQKLQIWESGLSKIPKKIPTSFMDIPLDGYEVWKCSWRKKGIFSSVLHIASNFVADEVFLSIEKN